MASFRLSLLLACFLTLTACQEQTAQESSADSSAVRDTATGRDTSAPSNAPKAADTASAGPTSVPQDAYTTTESGLKYYDLQEGNGASPEATDRVQVHYTGWLQSNGEKFDSSYDRGQPTTFPLNRVIAGWTEGLQSMEVGGKRQLVVPSDLGYGQRGTPDGTIPPGATLVFEVELLDVVRNGN